MNADRANPQRYLALRRGATSIVLAAVLYQAVAQSGYFAPALMPGLPTIAQTLFGLVADRRLVLGLGWVIFDAQQFLNADVMMASILVIGLIGFFTERLVFGSLERATIYRWGIARMAKG